RPPMSFRGARLCVGLRIPHLDCSVLASEDDGRAVRAHEDGADLGIDFESVELLAGQRIPEPNSLVFGRDHEGSFRAEGTMSERITREVSEQAPEATFRSFRPESSCMVGRGVVATAAPSGLTAQLSVHVASGSSAWISSPVRAS